MPRPRGFSSSVHLFILFSLVIGGSLPAGAMEVAQPVSPGELAALPIVEGRCPTFSWVQSEGAESYELVVFELSEDEGSSVLELGPAVEMLTDMRPALRVSLPKGSSSWTPSGEHCLESGNSYAWALRPLAPGHEVEWSEAYLFEVAAPPAAMEIRDALDTLQRYLDEGGESGRIADGGLGARCLSGCDSSPCPCSADPQSQQCGPDGRGGNRRCRRRQRRLQQCRRHCRRLPEHQCLGDRPERSECHQRSLQGRQLWCGHRGELHRGRLRSDRRRRGLGE